MIRLRRKHDSVPKLCPQSELQAITSANRKLVAKCHFLPLIVNNRSGLKWKTDRLFSLSCPPAQSFPPTSPLYHTIAYFLWFTLFLAHFLHLLPTEGWEPPRQSIWVAHLISQTVSPRLPQQSIPAVVEAVRSGKFFPRVLDVSSLSPDHSQEGQLAQVHLNTISPELLIQITTKLQYYFFLNTPNNNNSS